MIFKELKKKNRPLEVGIYIIYLLLKLYYLLITEVLDAERL